MSSVDMPVIRRRRRSSADDTQSLHLTCRMRQMMSLSKTSNIPSLTTRKGHVSQLKNRSERTTALSTRRKNAERARLILPLISLVPWPLATNIEPRYLNLSASSKGSLLSWLGGGNFERQPIKQ